MTSVVIPPDFGRGVNGKSRADRRRRQALFAKQEGKCHWCGEPMELEYFRTTAIKGRVKHNPAFATFEHLRPRCNGGTKSPDNIVLAHATCNHSRAKRRFPHDPLYGDGSVPLPPAPDRIPKRKKKRKRKIATPNEMGPATRRALLGGYLIDK